MSGDLLREAAALLRQQTEAATPEPWATDPDNRSAELWGDLDHDTRCIGQQVPWGDAAYIATMHPGVGLALADWLDAVADRIEEIHESLPFSARLTLNSLNVTAVDQALAVANAILGRQS